MTRPLTVLLLLLASLQLSAAPGWETVRTSGAPVSRAPELKLSGPLPGLAFLREQDGNTVLDVLESPGSPSPAWTALLGPAEPWQYDMIIDPSGRPFVFATAASNALRLFGSTNGTLTPGPAVSLNAHSPRLFLNKGVVYEFFTVISNDRHRLFLNTFGVTDAGRFPFDPRPVAPELDGPALQGLFFPVCAFASNRCVLVFVRRTEEGNRRTDTVWQSVSTNNGTTWSRAARLSLENFDAQYPWASGRSKLLLVSFLQTFSNREQRLVTLASTNRGASFSRITHTNFAFPAYFTRTFLREDGIHLTGYDYSRQQKSVVFHRLYDPAARSWGDPEWLSPTNANAWNYTTALDDRKVWIAWENDRKAVQFTENDTSCAAPVVFSRDIDTNWENSAASPVIQWMEPEDGSGIRSFAYLLDNAPGTVPDIENAEGNSSSRGFDSLSDGRWYFHIRAVDGKGNWSPTTHFGFTVNSSPLATPVVSSATHPEFSPTSDRNPVFQWSMPGEKRRIAGYSYLLTQMKNREPEEKILATKTMVRFNRLAPGVWYFYVKAVDQNGLWSSYAVYTINIQETVLASDRSAQRRPAGPEGLVTEENESAVSYTVGNGEVLSSIIRKALGLRPEEDANDYMKEIVRFNHIQDPDRMAPGDKVLFPIIIVKKDMSLDALAEVVFGDPAARNLISVLDRPDATDVRIGDKVMFKDRYFLMTGKVRERDGEAPDAETGTLPLRDPGKDPSAPGRSGTGTQPITDPQGETNTRTDTAPPAD
jgi:hypothetical protein